jgi:uncharacterized phage-associated protein
MRFHYNATKAAEAAAFLIRLKGGEIDLLALMKLLYLADRKALIETGVPITGDLMVNMPHGPVLSLTYDQTKWPSKGRESHPWCRLIRDREGNALGLRSPETVSFDNLSDYEKETLRSVFDQFGDLDPWDLSTITHDLPEYHDPEGSSSPIDHRELLEKAGVDKERIAEMYATSEEIYFLLKFDSQSPPANLRQELEKPLEQVT